ncbi:paired amphipathic helix protein Sin3b isoform X2 [Neocloeon triangulifer]|uniref:paired amphipathic helix protein Sin3b isoform X2 n=1 Tax=Neocloeon triangulifer TaxID=2078957 RepID=UPI00286EEE1D|nr:paired amphipathic helix protein Sin3b isoform X2 [Neocloeon triangulifer]
MKRRADELLVGVKSEPSSVVPPAAASALGPGVCPPGVRGPSGLGAVPPPHTVVLSRQSPAPQQITPQLQQHLLSIPASSQCVLTTNSIAGPPGPTVVQAYRTSSPVISKSDAAPPTMPGSIQFPVQNYPNPVPSAAPKGSAAAGAPAPVAGSSAVISRNLGASRPPNKVPRPSMSRPLPPSRSGSIDGASPQVPVMPPTQPSSNLSSAQQSQQQFQRLKVEDALSYLDQVKFKFGTQPQVYNDFLDIMKEFKSQSIDTPGVIARVSNLFKGHPELIVGFNTFLPPGYKIEVQANDQGYAFQVSVSMPSPTNTNSVGTITQHHTLPISTSTTTQVITTTIVPIASTTTPTSVVTQQPATPPAPSVPSKPLTVASSAPIGLAAVHHAATSLHGYSTGMPPSSSPHHPQSGSQPPSIPLNSAPAVGGGPSLLGHAGAMLAETMQPTPQSQPVDFSHAINYVNKIKHRFQGQPDKYKSFLDILHAYQKEQRNVKEGLATPGKHLTEAEVYAQVAKLFENQEDLVQEFGQFLPDATSHQAALMGALQGSKGLSNDHSSNKKPLGLKPSFNNANAGLSNLSMGSSAMSASSKFGQVKRSSPFSSSGQPMKKAKVSACLRDVTLAEAGKLGNLTDYAFFDKVRKALKNPEIYENFLRCLVLFNQEIVSGTELVQLVTPFLSRFPELLKWFKEFLGHNETMVGSSTYQSLHCSSVDSTNSSNRQDRATGELAMEIDYSTCKRLGASYCALPKNYAHSKCSGRTALCKEVLNDTWVSFPTWSSEDSTFVTSRKTQFEESIYRCEDERFELDVVLETNAATIRVLEGVFKKMTRMQPDEVAKFHLDDCLGGTSATIHQRAIRRIYGDKAPDIIMGLKKNPSAAVPVVLRRLKAKEEEWREAQKGFNKIWRDQNEKYYLKSLDHQGINFKQNDLKTLRSKALFNEIETLYDERHEQAEDGNNEQVTGPHMVLRYRDKTILDDAANLLIHHVKRQTGIHKDDKQTIKQLLKQFLPDIFFHHRQELSDDERDDDASDKEDSEGSPSNKKVRVDKKEPEKKNGNGDNAKIEVKEKPSTTTNSSEEVKVKEDLATPAHAISAEPDEHYSLFMTCNTWYCFLRLHQILCERLTRMYECAQKLVAEEAFNKSDRKESTAIALRLKPKSDIDVEDYYPAFLDMVKNVLDGNMDTNAFEDTLREMFGIHAYIAFTLDKVVANAVRQLQQLVVDDSSQECLDMFNDEKKKGATGGLCSKAAQNAILEMAYQKRAEQALSEENCYKIYIYKKDCRMTIELLDTDGEEQEAPAEAEKREEYADKYVGEMDSIPEEIKERLSRKPVFLPRCVRNYMDRSKQFQNQERSSTAVSTSGNNSPSSSNEPKEAEAKSDEEKKKEGGKVRADSPQSGSIDSNECRFNLNNYARIFFMDKDALLVKKNALLNAREAHPKVTKKLLKKFRSWHEKWASAHVSEDQQKSTKDWLMGLGENMVQNRTRVLTDNDLSKTPYIPYNRYRVELESVVSAVPAAAPATATTTTNGPPPSP